MISGSQMEIERRGTGGGRGCEMKRAFKSLINWRVDLLFTPGLEHFDHDVGEGMAETL